MGESVCVCVVMCFCIEVGVGVSHNRCNSLDNSFPFFAVYPGCNKQNVLACESLHLVLP